MDTNSLKQSLNQLIPETKKAAQELSQVRSAIQSAQQQAQASRSQAQSYRSQANSLMGQANSSEDESQASSLRSMASAYYSKAEDCEYRAEQFEERAEQGRQRENTIKGTLRNQVGGYQSIISECKTNIAALGQALGKLQAVSGAKYGASAASKALQATQDRINTTKAIGQKSSQGIQYISQLIGESFSASSSGSSSVSGGTFDAKTARFSHCFGEMGYDRVQVMRSINITNGMMNDDPAKASAQFSSKVRHEIQMNAVSQQLQKNPTYFRQFGCTATTPSQIVGWFSNNPNYTLHETNVQTVQIVNAKMHRGLDHSGGVSSEKADLISGDGIRSKYNGGNT